MKPQMDGLGDSAAISWRVLLSSCSVWHGLKSSACQTEGSLKANALLAISLILVQLSKAVLNTPDAMI